MPTGRAASALNVDPGIDPVEYCHQQGWTDGLPVVPPTRERVEAMMDTMARGAHEVVAVLPPIDVDVTVEKLAINAVMAGCLPEYFPVVVTAIECLAQRRAGLTGMLTTIHGDSPMVIVNGPVVRKLGFNAGSNTFGPGWRANATVGRAVALVMRNLAVGPPGQLDVATQTSPGKFGCCIAEFEEVSPWVPLHVERGFNIEDSTLTAVGALAPHHVTDMVSTTGKGVLTTLADAMAIIGTYNIYMGGEVLIVMCPTHARVLADEGWSKDDVKYYLWENARKPLWKLKQGGNYGWGGGPNWPKWIDTEDDSSSVPVVFKSEDIIIMVAGGEVGGYSSVVFCFAVQSITLKIPFE